MALPTLGVLDKDEAPQTINTLRSGRAAAADSAGVALSTEDKTALDALATQVTAAAILAKIIAAPATEAKQDTLIAKDFATQATLAAVLAKIIATPSTEAKQDTANTSLSTIAGKDFATQATLAAILAKIIAAPATEAKQDTGNTSLSTIAGKDFATQATLAAVLAKIIAAPATEAKQDTGNTSLSTIAGKDFATQATLASVLAKIIAAPATEAKQDTQITALGPQGAAVSATFTPAAAAYSANDIIEGAKQFSAIGPSGATIRILSCELEIDHTALISGETSYRLYLYNVTPPSAPADNAAFDIPSGDRASFLGYVDLGFPIDLGSTLYVQTGDVNKDIKLSGTSVFGLLVTAAGFTATAAARKVTLHTVPV